MPSTSIKRILRLSAVIPRPSVRPSLCTPQRHYWHVEEARGERFKTGCTGDGLTEVHEY